MATRRYILIATLILNVSIVKSFGEVLTDPFNNAINTLQNNSVQNSSSQNREFNNGLANQLAGQAIGNTNWVQDNSAQNQANSREKNALDAQTQGNTGAGAAIAAGTTMIATGISMILTLDPYLIAAGSQLIAQGGMELAQAGVNSEGSTFNGNQRDTLNALQAPLAGANSSNSNPKVQQALNNPALDKALADAGVDPEQFKQQLASGAFKSGNDVLSVLGKSVDPEVMAQGEQLASAKMGDILGTTSKSDANTITSNGEMGLSAGGIAKNSNEGASSTNELQKSNHDESQNLIAANGMKKAVNSQETKEARDPMSSFMDKMFGLGNSMDLSEKKAVLAQELASMGIQTAVKGVSIFAIAHRKYTEFGKTRKKATRVAQR